MGKGQLKWLVVNYSIDDDRVAVIQQYYNCISVIVIIVIIYKL